MKGLQGFAYQKNNRLLDAAIAATVAASGKLPLVYPVTKKGTGTIALSGAFTGADDAQYDIKIVDTALDTPVVSAPIFRGAGTGKIRDISVAGLVEQKITVRCMSTGISTKASTVEIEGIRFRAKVAGAEGNAINIDVDDTTLVFTATDYSTIKALAVGDTGLVGPEWDFDTKVLLGDIVPSNAHRLAFGLDRLHIYRQYKKFEEGAYKYYFVMPIKYAVPAGSKVYIVTGGRTITVSDGVTTEVYNDIVTIADFWSAVRNTSALLEPLDSAIDTSLKPSSPAVREFAVKTDAYALPAYRDDKSSIYAGELTNIVAKAGTKTELIEFRCVDNAFVGAELWDVKGSSSGVLGQCRTGEINDFGPIVCEVPQKLPTDFTGPKEDFSHEVTYASRAAGVSLPPICFSMRLGINAAAQTLTLTYRKKPTACACTTTTFGDSCLGFEEKGGEIGMPFITPDLVFWLNAFIETFTESITSAESGEINTRSVVSRYQSLFSTLASRIMALPEPEAAGAQQTALEALIADYKSLVGTLGINGTIEPLNLATIEVSFTTALYTALVDDILAYECAYGLKKNSITPAGTCWIDVPGDYYWEVRGNKAYLPAFTDTPYYSTIKQGETYVNTKEFAVNISVPCGGSLVEGDKITVSIGGIQISRTYLIGDTTYLPTIAAQALYLTGGIDGDDTYVWEVAGSVAGLFAPYLLDRTSPAAYSDSGLGFTIDDGIIPFQVDDLFEFSIEGGHFQWRKDGGAWSAALDISPIAQDLDAGLQIAFLFGVAPSFITDDQWEVLCLQENRAVNMADIDTGQYKGTGNVVVSFAAPVEIDTLIIDDYEITGDFSFQASDSADFSVLIHDELIAAAGRLPLICKLYLDAPITAKYFRLVPAIGSTICFCFLGNLMRLSADTDKIKPVKQYVMDRKAGKRSFGLTNYVKAGYTLSYDTFLSRADFALLDELVEWSKGNNDEPFYLIPNTDYPNTVIKGLIDSDNIEMDYVKDENMPVDDRLYTINLPIVGTR